MEIWKKQGDIKLHPGDKYDSVKHIIFVIGMMAIKIKINKKIKYSENQLIYFINSTYVNF